jgi:broad specificity phosphatase PhoE
VIVLLRHGTTDLNASGRFLSRADPPLNAEGRVQAQAVRNEIERYGPGRVMVSPALRARETAALAVPDVAPEPRAELREIDFGTWEGCTLAEVAEVAPDAVAARRRDPVDFRPPEGESFRDVAVRLQSLVRDLRQAEGNVLVVAHRGTLGVLERLLRGLDLRDPSVHPIEPGCFRMVPFVVAETRVPPQL